GVGRVAGEGGGVARRVVVGGVVEVPHHARLGVDAVYDALGRGARQAHREVAGARTDVGDRRVRRDRERRDHLAGLLPGVARRIVEDLRPALGVGEAVLVHLLREGGGTERREDRRDGETAQLHAA